MRRIALITTSRAEYGIQSRLIRMLQDDPEIDFRLIVSGTHLSKKHGCTVKQIEADGIKVAEKVDIGIDKGWPVAKIMATALEKMSVAIQNAKPDLAVLLGDRYEMLSVALACTLNNIPIAHLHGGETTIGATDEVFRHAITKAAYLHFTSCEEYRRRVIQLGEDPKRVFNVGSLGVENCRKFKLLTRPELEKELGFKFAKHNILVTFHPVTFEQGSAAAQVDELIAAIAELNDTQIVITHPNADLEGDLIADRFKAFAKGRQNVHLLSSLGSLKYLSFVKQASAIVGNSSSGVIEVPSFNVPTVNIGNRQAGRIMPDTVICCEPKREAITKAIEKAFSKDFRALIVKAKNPYEKKDTAKKIFKVLKTFPIKNACSKRFYDLRSGGK